MISPSNLLYGFAVLSSGLLTVSIPYATVPLLHLRTGQMDDITNGHPRIRLTFQSSSSEG